MSTRQPVQQAQSLQDRLISFAKEAHQKASLLPPGAEQDALLEKARQAETALSLNTRLNKDADSAESSPPK